MEAEEVVLLMKNWRLDLLVGQIPVTPLLCWVRIKFLYSDWCLRCSPEAKQGRMIWIDQPVVSQVTLKLDQELFLLLLNQQLHLQHCF